MSFTLACYCNRCSKNSTESPKSPNTIRRHLQKYGRNASGDTTPTQSAPSLSLTSSTPKTPSKSRKERTRASTVEAALTDGTNFAYMRVDHSEDGSQASYSLTSSGKRTTKRMSGGTLSPKYNASPPLMPAKLLDTHINGLKLTVTIDAASRENNSNSPPTTCERDDSELSIKELDPNSPVAADIAVQAEETKNKCDALTYALSQPTPWSWL
jgi:hypothetical protein